MQFLSDKFHWTNPWIKLPLVAMGFICAALATTIAGLNWWRSHHQDHALNSVREALRPIQASPITIAPVPITVPFKVCGEATSWTRPSQAEQQREIRTLPRYTTGLDQEPLHGLYQRFQRQFIFTFTAYGISLRLEPIYLSGLWTVQSTLRNCYDPDRIARLNNGQLAEVWILLHRVVSLQWLGDRYVMVVEPAAKGVQFIQFPRSDRDPFLPLQVITRDGKSLDVFSSTTLVESAGTQ